MRARKVAGTECQCSSERHMNISVVPLYIIFIAIFHLTRCERPDNDLFSSTAEIEKLFVWERDFVVLLREFRDDIDTEHLHLTEDRLHQRKLSIVNSTARFPDFNQIEGAVNGLYLLQDAFNLNISRFANGNVFAEKLSDKSYQSHTALGYQDVEGIAKISYNRMNYHRAVDWFRTALEVAIKGNNKAEVATARNFLKTTMKAHDKVLEQKGPSGFSNGKVWETNVVPYDEKLRKKKKYKNALKEFNKKEENYKMTVINSYADPILNEQFNRLCKGETLLAPELSKDTNCFYLHHFDPYLRLGPFKVEDQSISPYVTVFRDFLAESEMEYYKEFARPRLFRSEFGGNKQGVTRTSKQTWLHDYDESHWMSANKSRMGVGPYFHKDDIQDERDPVGAGVSDRITLATGLYAAASGGGEAYQVANYGLGGFYGHHPDPHFYHHYDFKHKDEGSRAQAILTGDRLATVMGYLSDVPLGGGTAFPNAGLHVRAEKGSVVFWWNLLTSGIFDVQTVHGGCPVLVGSKWITNKWIRWKYQELKVRCRRGLARRQERLSNQMCEDEARCTNRHQIFYNAHWYYQHLKAFSPDFI